MQDGASYYLEKMREMPPFDLDGVPDIIDPELVAKLVGPVLQFSASIESEVGASRQVPELILPNMDDELAEFLGYWYPHEIAHGATQKKVLEIIDLEPMETKGDKITKLYKTVGRMTLLSDNAHTITELTTMGYMAFGEMETQSAYRKLAHLMHGAGEIELARFFGLTAGQESVHLGYQSNRARELAEKMPDWQVKLSAKILRYIYEPVGVDRGDEFRMGAMGRLLKTLSEDKGETLAESVAELGHSIFPSFDEEDDFLAKKYLACVAKAA